MKSYLTIVLLLLVTACSSTSSVKEEQEALQASEVETVQIEEDKQAILEYGLWSGKIDYKSTQQLLDVPTEGEYDILVFACTEVPDFFLKFGDQNYQRIYTDYQVEQDSGSTILTKSIKGSGWVESQSWIVVSIDEDNAYIQWSRAVSNVNDPKEEPLRAFGQLGHGNIQRQAEECPEIELTES